MASWDSADLLSRVKEMARRSVIDNDMTDAKWYVLLAEAQRHWLGRLATYVPESNYGAPTALVTADGGYTYYINNAGSPAEFYGSVVLRDGLAGQILYVGADADPRSDLCQEGETFRVPEGRTRTFGAGLYAKYVAVPDLLDGTHPPVLKPASARILLVYRACILYASRGGAYDPRPYENLEKEAFFGDQKNGDIGILGGLKAKFTYALPIGGGVPQAWYKTGDLAPR